MLSEKTKTFGIKYGRGPNEVMKAVGMPIERALRIKESFRVQMSEEFNPTEKRWRHTILVINNQQKIELPSKGTEELKDLSK